MLLVEVECCEASAFSLERKQQHRGRLEHRDKECVETMTGTQVKTPSHVDVSAIARVDRTPVGTFDVPIAIRGEVLLAEPAIGKYFYVCCRMEIAFRGCGFSTAAEVALLSDCWKRRNINTQKSVRSKSRCHVVVLSSGHKSI